MIRQPFNVRTLAALFVAALGTLSHAAPILSLEDGEGDPHAVTVNAGQSFNVTVKLDADEPFFSYGIYLVDIGHDSATRFTITNRTSVENPFTDSNKPDSTFLNNPLAPLSADLGYSADDFTTPAPQGPYNLMTLTFQTDSSLSGDYTISVDGTSNFTNESFDDLSYATGAGYQVKVNTVPEPSIWGGLLLGALAFLDRRRR